MSEELYSLSCVSRNNLDSFSEYGVRRRQTKFVGQRCKSAMRWNRPWSGIIYDIRSIRPTLRCYYSAMSKTEILDELPTLTKEERDEIRRKLTEIDGESWFADDEELSSDEKALLDSRLAAYLKDPDIGSSWEEVESRIRARLTR